jgi:hypothetical protein
VLRRLRGIFGGPSGRGASGDAPEASGAPILDPEESARIGTEEDPLRGYEAAVERHMEAVRAEQRGDTGYAISLYEKSVAEGFVGSRPYEALAALHERSRNPAAALRVTEAYIRLAKSNTLPRGAQRSADRKLPDFKARAARYRRLTNQDPPENPRPNSEA